MGAKLALYMGDPLVFIRRGDQPGLIWRGAARCAKSVKGYC